MEPKCITMSRSGRVLVVGMEMGVIRSLRQPLTYSNEWFDFRIHLDQINAVSPSFLICKTEAGSIFMDSSKLMFLRFELLVMKPFVFLYPKTVQLFCGKSLTQKGVRQSWKKKYFMRLKYLLRSKIMSF